MSDIQILNSIVIKLDSANKKLFGNDNLDPYQYQSPTLLLAWDKLCRPKYEGGLGIRNKDVMLLC